ncbi:hypothetical protein VDGL01_08515 [Verticillium dahliae]
MATFDRAQPRRSAKETKRWWPRCRG